MKKNQKTILILLVVIFGIIVLILIFKHFNSFTTIATTKASTTNSEKQTATDNDNLLLGNPSNAVTDISYPDNYLLVKPQYAVGYNNSKGEPMWVAWHLDLSNCGKLHRCDCFLPDSQLPESFFAATASNYTASGFDRGHQCPSAERENSETDNAATFLMTNMLPQAPHLNQITWKNLEEYSLHLVHQGYELYIYCGGYGSGGTGRRGGITKTIDHGKINVPSNCWKIIVVLPIGENDLNRVTDDTRVIAVDMPNTQTVSGKEWGEYRTSVKAIEQATGLDLLSNVPATIQEKIESKVDNE